MKKIKGKEVSGMLTQHYCQEHQTKFFKNEKTDASGQLKVWYSHKKADGTGFCVEKNGEEKLKPTRSVEKESMFACNAMNNAIALANSGKIGLDQIEIYYQKILSTLENNN